MIIKVYHPNGAPDMRRWEVQCDHCPVREPLMGSEHWFIPMNPHMPMYCPACADYQAMFLIDTGLCCPACTNPTLTLAPAPNGTYFAACPRCGSYLTPDTGWHQQKELPE